MNNYYTLLKLKNELDKFIGMELVEVFSQEKDTIMFGFSDSINEYFLIFSDVLQQPAIYINDRFARSNKNSVDVFPMLKKERLQEVAVIKNERIVILKFIHLSVCFLLFGGNNANIFICNKRENILQAYIKSNTYINTKFEYKIKEYPEFMDIDKNLTIRQALNQSNLAIPKLYITEFCAQNNINPDSIINDFSLFQLENLYVQATKFILNYLSATKSYLLQDSLNKIHFSLLPLTNFNVHNEYNSVSDAIRFYQIIAIKEAKTATIMKELMPQLRREERRLLAGINLAKSIDEVLQRAEKYRNYAELLISQNDIKSKKGNSINLNDWGGNLVEIALDEKLNILDNAQKYYEKVRKTMKDAEVRAKRLPILEAKYQEVSSSIALIENAENLKELEKARQKLAKESVVIMQNEERKIDTKFRKFELGDGYIIYVGKNASNNDELTMKFAKPNDIWLHARGSSGSHCVVRLENGGKLPEKLPKNILKSAAEIAAFYSGSKNAKFTPVCYTQKKYVHKPKGANVGAVSLQKEEIIMVEPKQPISEQL